MNKYKINIDNLTTSLTIEQLKLVKRLKTKIKIIKHKFDLNNSELTVDFAYNNEIFVLYLQIKQNEIVLLEAEAKTDLSVELQLLQVAAMQYFNEFYDGYYTNIEQKNIVVNKKISDFTSKVLSNKYGTVKYYLQLHIIDFKTNSIKFKISDSESNSYTIKDLFAFVKNIEANLTSNYNNLVVEHKEIYFQNNIKLIIDLIKQYYIIKYDEQLTTFSNNSSSYITVSNGKMLDLIASFETIYYNGKKYNCELTNNKIQISVSENDDKYIVNCEQNYFTNSYYNVKLVNNKFYIKRLVNQNSKKLIDVLTVSQIVNLSELYDLYCVINNELSDDFKFDYDVSIFETDDISPITLNVSQSDNDILLNIEVSENKIIDKSRIKLISNLLTNYKAINEFNYLVNERDIYTFLKYSLKLIEQYVDHIVYDEFTNKLLISDEALFKIKVKESKSLLNIRFLNPSLSEEQINYILTTNDKYYKIDNVYVDIESDANRQLMEFVKANNIIKNNSKISSYNKLYLENLKKNLHIDSEQIVVPTVKSYNILNFELRDYQKEGLNFLLKLNKYKINGILADDMGLGKTIQVISLLQYLETDKPHLIIVPASLMYNWQSEINKFSSNLTILLYRGNKRSNLIKEMENFNIIIATYDTVRVDIDKLKDIEFEYIILDEAQYIKNYKSQISIAVRKLCSNHKLCLTGTPIENNISEIWSLIDFLNPSYLNTIQEFNKTYSNTEMLPALKSKLSPIMLRRTKEQVLKDLPEKMIATIQVEMTTLQKAIYDQALTELQTNIKTNNNKIEILSYITKLRQICTNPKLIDDNYHELPRKYEILVDKLVELKTVDSKTVVFTQFTKNFKYLTALFADNNISYYEISGKTPSSLRHTLVNKFNEDKTNVMLISLKAGGSGLNIVGANTVIHIDPWWNYAVESQANDRVHRIGQTKKVSVYKLITTDSIEQAIEKMQENKNKLSSSLLDIEQNILSLNNDEILQIVNNSTI